VFWVTAVFQQPQKPLPSLPLLPSPSSAVLVVRDPVVRSLIGRFASAAFPVYTIITIYMISNHHVYDASYQHMSSCGPVNLRFLLARLHANRRIAGWKKERNAIFRWIDIVVRSMGPTKAALP
jgi:hypothetical protein